MKQWFRMYAEFASDPKVQLLSFDDQRHFVVLLCLKCSGTLDSATPSSEFRDRMLAKALGLSHVTFHEASRRLIEVGLIDDNYQPTAWSARQYDSDSSVERTRAWRARQKTERHCDVTVTDKNRTEEKIETQKRASRLPDDFSLTPERQLVAEAETLPAERTFASFCDYWRAESGAKARKLDWDAAWRTWCRRSRDFSKGGKPHKDPFAGAVRG